ncbi:MAG TPA: hypothetical protein VFW00_09395, partial [Rhodocyclaceae bacterium]|nr:hypothetical protein [Rhodocyclaceae bacterium]
MPRYAHGQPAQGLTAPPPQPNLLQSDNASSMLARGSVFDQLPADTLSSTSMMSSSMEADDSSSSARRDISAVLRMRMGQVMTQRTQPRHAGMTLVARSPMSFPDPRQLGERAAARGDHAAAHGDGAAADPAHPGAALGDKRAGGPAGSAGAKPRDPHDKQSAEGAQRDGRGGRQAAHGGGAHGAPHGAAGAAEPDLDSEDSAADLEQQDALAAVESTELDIPLSIDVQPLDSEWRAPTELPQDALADAGKAHGAAAARAPEKPAGKKEAKKKGKQEDHPKPKGPADQEREAQAMIGARSSAQRAYRDLASEARRSQEGFVGEANRVANYMAQQYGITAGEISHAHDDGIQRIDFLADQACSDIESSSTTAELTLQVASDNALLSIQGAARSAWGAISASDRAASAHVSSMVSTLVSGHEKAFQEVIDNTKNAADATTKALDNWTDTRSTDADYTTTGASAMDNAKHEKQQQRIPILASHEKEAVKTRTDHVIANWQTTSTSTVCALSCSYRAAIEAERTRTFMQARQSVGSALERAKKGLSDQVRAARRTLRQMRASALNQVRTRQRSAKSQLTSKARADLSSVRREAQAGISTLQSAARSSMPGYAHNIEGLEQTLRRAAGRSAAAITQTAQAAPENIQRGLVRTTAQLSERLTDNQQHLDSSLKTAKNDDVVGRAAQIEETNVGLTQTVVNTATQTSTSTDGFVQAFNGLSGTVRQAADSWVKPPDILFKAFMASKQAEADAALQSLRQGTPPAGGGGGGQAGGDSDTPAPVCTGCATDAGGGAGPGGGAGGGGPGGGGAAPAGLDAQGKAEVDFCTPRGEPKTFFLSQMNETATAVESNLRDHALRAQAGLEWSVGWSLIDVQRVSDSSAVPAALRGLDACQAHAVDVDSFPHLSGSGTTLTDMINDRMSDGHDRNAALAYLRGDAVEGAKEELESSMHWYNDDEARIEATMRALSPDQLAALGQDTDLHERVHSALDGTDQQVFDALAQGNYAQADAYRMRDAIDSARLDGNADAVHTAIEQYTGAPAEGDWRSTQEMSGDDRRADAVAELGRITSGEDLTGAPALRDLTPEQRAALTTQAEAYVTRDITMYADEGGSYEAPASESGEYGTYALQITGANRDLAVALLRHGPDSVEARAARLGVELQRTGDPPNPLNLDRAMYDQRFMPDNPHATREEIAANEERRKAARADRAQVLLLAAQSYGGQAPPPEGTQTDTEHPLSDPHVTSARDTLVQQMGDRFGDDDLGRQLSAGLLTDERPSAQTASLAMQHAMKGAGTNEELLFRFTERMTRDEVAAMRDQFRADTGKSLDAELGVYGQGHFGELSGDDALRMERAMLGVARDDRERAEVGAFAIQQQRQETGGFGRWLAGDSMADEAMRVTDEHLRSQAGGTIDLSPEALMSGRPLIRDGNFDQNGRYTGPNRDEFLATANSAQQVAQNYSSRIDAYANLATTGIAILGAIAAAVITVVTGGAAGPLMIAALAAGLTSMAANYAIKGGRYGWEQAGIDLGMTLVQVVTAGVGAQLGAAAQVAAKGAAAAEEATSMIVSLSRIFTGNPVIDQIIIGAAVGSISGLGTTLLSEQTWDGNGEHAVGALFEGLARGLVSGAVTAAATQSLEALGGLGQRLQELSTEVGGAAALRNMLVRGAGRSLIAGVSSMAGRGSEILFDASTGHYHGDAGDALMDIGEAGIHAALQGLGEGMGEAHGTGRRAPTLHAAEEAINNQRRLRNLPPLEGPALHAAAEDLLFLAQHGRDQSAAGRAAHADVIATHGSLEGASHAMAHGTATAAPHPAASHAEHDATAPTAAAHASAEPAATHVTGEAPITHAGAGAEEATAPHPAASASEKETSTSHTAATDASTASVPTATHASEAGTESATHPAAHAGESGGSGGEGPPRRPSGSSDAGGEGESDRLLPHLTDSEVGHAIDSAEARMRVRVGADQPGADARPAPAGEATLLQRQRAGALHEQADGLMAHANELLDHAIAREAEAQLADLHNPRRAERLREEANRALNEAVALESQAHALRMEAAEYSSGRRSATADLPGPEDVDAMFAGLESEGPGLVKVPLSDVERNPELLQRLVRPLLEGEGGGRMVFRVESERSRSLVSVDAEGNVTVEGGASAHLNFGSYERAVEFIMQNSRGNARIISFEVDENWVRSLRSAAIPEHGTADLHGQPRLVDVRFAHDQMEIPAGLIGELNRFIVPGSGRVHEIPAATPPSGSGTPHIPEGAAAAIFGSRMQLSETPVITDAPAALHAAMDEVINRGPAGNTIDVTHTGPGVAVRMTDAEGRPLRVRIEVGETQSGDVANFRRAGEADEGFDFVVHLSPRAPQEAHARALAHELAELRLHDVVGVPHEDALRSAAPPEPGARLSAHDVGRLAELEVLAQRLNATPESDLPRRATLQSDIDALTAHLGLLHPADVDLRLQLARGALPEGSAARAALNDSRARARTDDSESDALQPGRPVDPKRPLTAADRRRVAQLEELLQRLPPQPATGSVESPNVQALRRQTEALAAEMGLVFGQHSGARIRLACSVIENPALVARLADIRQSAQRNPLILPLTGTNADIPLLLRQMQAAQAMGDNALAGRLAQVAGLHLESSGAFAARPADRIEAQRIIREIRDPALRSALGDVLQRHSARLEAPRIRAEAATLRERLGRMQSDLRADGAAAGTPQSLERQQRIDGLAARAQALETEAAALERVASRPQDMSSAAARAFSGQADDFPAIARIDDVPGMINDRTNARLVRQLYSDSPHFQSWREFSRIRTDANRGQSFVEVGMGRGGNRLDYDNRMHVESYENSYARWVRGHYMDAETGQYNQLSDLRLIKPQASTPVPTTAHLSPTDTIDVPQRTAHPVTGEPVRGVVTLHPDDVATYREQLMRRRDTLNVSIEPLPEGSPARLLLEAERSRVQADLSETSEALGVAAGRKVAEEQGLHLDP